MTYRIEEPTSGNRALIVDQFGEAFISVWARETSPLPDLSHDKEEMMQRARQLVDFFNGAANDRATPGGALPYWDIRERRPSSSTNSVRIFSDDGRSLTLWTKKSRTGGNSHDQDEVWARAQLVASFLSGEPVICSPPLPPTRLEWIAGKIAQFGRRSAVRNFVRRYDGIAQAARRLRRRDQLANKGVAL